MWFVIMLCDNMPMHNVCHSWMPTVMALACISYLETCLGNNCYYMIGYQIINRIMW